MTDTNPSSRFWIAGAVYWIAVMAALILAVQIWPRLIQSAPFFYAAILGATAGGFAIVYLMRAKP
jgi:hypothetical protein